jgi:hypothetical protein
VTLLKWEEHKKSSGEFYYTLNFLDDSDNSYRCFINEDIYKQAIKFKRFDYVDLNINLYKSSSGQLGMSVSSITKSGNPFDK